MKKTDDDLLARTLATRDRSYLYTFDFDRPLSDQSHQECYDWCKKNCKEEWTFSPISERWRFMGERDYLMFCLKWGSR
jgi:phosphoserine phosphatase